MTPENFKAWQKELEVSRIQFEIQLAERSLAFWIKVEKERRAETKVQGKVLFDYIRKAKQYRKEAQDRLNYWKEQLQKLAA